MDLVAATPCYPGCIFTDLSGDGMNGGIGVEGEEGKAGVTRWGGCVGGDFVEKPSVFEI